MLNHWLSSIIRSFPNLDWYIRGKNIVPETINRTLNMWKWNITLVNSTKSKLTMSQPKCINNFLSNLNLFLKEMVSLFTYFYGYCQNWKELSIYVVTLHTYYIRNACLCFYGRKLVIESQTDRKTDRWTSQCLD